MEQNGHKAVWATVRLTCGDGRIQRAILDYAESMGGLSDPVPAPGGVKKFVRDQNYREKVLEDLRTYIGLHNPTKLLVLQHEDCGAYGGSGAFASREAEQRAHQEELERALPLLQEAFPQLRIVPGYVRKITEEQWEVIPATQPVTA